MQSLGSTVVFLILFLDWHDSGQCVVGIQLTLALTFNHKVLLFKPAVQSELTGEEDLWF